MEPIAKRGEKSLRQKQRANSPRRSKDEWTRRLLAKPSASRSGILRPTTPSCSGLFGQRHVDFQSVHSAGKKDVNMVQENGFLRSPSCTSRVELTENMEYTANDSDEWTSTDQRAIKKEFEGEGSLCHEACQRKELDRKQDHCSDKEFSRQSRLPTDAISLKQTHSGESCHRRGVRDKSLSSDSALVEYEMTYSCEKPSRLVPAEEPFPLVQPFRSMNGQTAKRSQMLGEIATQHSHINPPSINKKGVKRERSSICAHPAEERLPEKMIFCASNIHTHLRETISVYCLWENVRPEMRLGGALSCTHW